MTAKQKVEVQATAPLSPIENMLDFFGSGDGSKDGLLLDIGCRDGRYARIGNYLTHLEAVGIDVSIPSQRYSYVSYVKSDLLHLPFKNEVFSHVLIINAFHHIPHDEKSGAAALIKEGGLEVRRVSRPNSNLLVVEQIFGNPLKKILEDLWQLLAPSVKRSLGWSLDSPNWELPETHILFEELQSSLETAGFKVSKVKRYGFAILYLGVAINVLAIACLKPLLSAFESIEITFVRGFHLTRFSSTVALYLKRVEHQ